MQDLEKFKNEMNLSGKNVYVGNRYTPKIFGEWDNTQIYEPLSIVQYQGTSYTSRQYVPVGIEITNEDYWAVTGNYNAQVEQYRQDVRNLENHVNTYDDKINEVKVANIKTNDKILNNFNTKYFNIVGDGVRDNSDEINQMLEEIPEGSKVTFEKGSYVVSKPIEINKSNISVDFNGSEIIWKSGNSVESNGIIKATGNLETAIDVTSFTSNRKGIELTVASHDLVKGDYIYLMGNTVNRDYVNNFLPATTILVKVSDVTETIIKVNFVNNYNYTADTYFSFAKANVISNVHVKNANVIDETTSGYINGVYLNYVVNSTVENINIKDTTRKGVKVQSCNNIKVSNIYATAQVVTAGSGYCLQVNQSNIVYLDNINGGYLRHLIDITQSVDVIARDSQGLNATNNAFDLHGISESSIVFENCKGDFIIGNDTSFPLTSTDIVLNSCFITNMTVNFAKNLKIVNSNLNGFNWSSVVDLILSNNHINTPINFNSDINRFDKSYVIVNGNTFFNNSISFNNHSNLIFSENTIERLGNWSFISLLNIKKSLKITENQVVNGGFVIGGNSSGISITDNSFENVGDLTERNFINISEEMNIVDVLLLKIKDNIFKGNNVNSTRWFRSNGISDSIKNKILYLIHDNVFYGGISESRLDSLENILIRENGNIAIDSTFATSEYITNLEIL